MTYTHFNDTYFFTATILNWQMLLSDDRMKQIIISSLAYMSSKERVKIYAFVIMPNHIHLLLRLEKDSTMCFQRDFLKYTAQRFIQILRNEGSNALDNHLSTQADRNYQIWERRPYWTIINRYDIMKVKLAYIHNNPINGKWKLAEDAMSYTWSSCAFYNELEHPYNFLINVHDMHT